MTSETFAVVVDDKHFKISFTNFSILRYQQNFETISALIWQEILLTHFERRIQNIEIYQKPLSYLISHELSQN
jgi:hypothetical protein